MMMTANTYRGLVTATLIAALCSFTAQAQIYKYTDKDGNVVFSDQPPSDSTQDTVEEVQLRETNTAPAPQVAPKAATTTENKPKKIAYSTTITSPADGTTIPMGPGNFAVSARVTPALGPGERLQLLMDGTPVSEPKRAGNWQLSNVFRGEHKLVVERLDRSGKALDSSAATTVYVLRPSVR